MNDQIIGILREKAKEISQRFPPPLFYRERKVEMERSTLSESQSREAAFARSIISGKGDLLGHGFEHARSVALDCCAIIYCERGLSGEGGRLAENALVAGYLHDIRRDESDHPGKGAGEVRRLFRERMAGRDVEMIAFAIKNHEAFKKHDIIEDRDFMLLSDALYDADKFRWGPDNFMVTLWDMAESMKIGPELIFRNYEKGIRGIERIRESFRTATGRKYGPDFIDIGLQIGEEIYRFGKDELKDLTY